MMIGSTDWRGTPFVKFSQFNHQLIPCFTWRKLELTFLSLWILITNVSSVEGQKRLNADGPMSLKWHVMSSNLWRVSQSPNARSRFWINIHTIRWISSALCYGRNTISFRVLTFTPINTPVLELVGFVTFVRKECCSRHSFTAPKHSLLSSP